MGATNTFGILASTYTNTIGVTTIGGDLGYAIGPAVAPTVSGTTHTADATYDQAGLDQASALVSLNSQEATFSFAPGAINLATDTTHGPAGVYTPGVYVIAGAASIGTAGITLNGAGTYIFRMDGALTSVADSAVRLTNGASSCDVFWTPTQATTLGANSTFAGTDIDASGITIGSTVIWAGKALAFGGTVSTEDDTITVADCAAAEDAARAGAGVTATATSASTSVDASSSATATTKFPNTGSLPTQNTILWSVVILNGILTISILVYLARRKQTK